MVALPSVAQDGSNFSYLSLREMFVATKRQMLMYFSNEKKRKKREREKTRGRAQNDGTEKRREKERGTQERTIITECHFGDIMRRASERAYFIMESHHIGYTITILIRHNGYLRSSRWGQERATWAVYPRVRPPSAT